MSNLTPEDVNLRLTETRNELQLEDTRLWQGLEDERVSRIAGEAANNNLIENTNTALAAQEARLSVEVVQREEGDLRNITSLSELAQALADYRIKTDLELNIERIARQQLGVDLNTRVDDFVATFDHKFLMVYQTIQTYQTSTTASINALDLRVKAYENMLQDITTDSIQITMDNGEINMGAWTILSQARQWDLEILAKFKDYKTQTSLDIDDALQDIQNQLPVEQTIINSALNALSNSQIIQNLDAAINSNAAGINTLVDDLLQEVSDRQSDMLTLSQNINDQLVNNQADLVRRVEAETAARINELQREASIRQQELVNEANERSAEIEEKLTIEEGERLQQIAQLQDGLTQEIQHRIDGDNASITALNNYKVSNDAALANIMQDLSANITATEANTSAITALDTRLTANETVAASAVTKAETALTQTSALATQVDSVKASIDGLETELTTKVDSTAFSALQADVSTIDGKVTSQGTQITTLNSSLTVTDKLTRLASQGKPLRDDANFKTEANLTIYETQPGYTLTRQAITAGNPSGSTHEYYMAMTQAITGIGIGFYPNPAGISTAASKVFLFKMVLKAPVGAVINIYKNATGTPSTYEMLGNNLGTGKFDTYYFWLQCGPTGTFSTAGHVAITQGTATVGTPSVPFEVTVASYEVWDVTTVDDSIPKIWADKVDANATAVTSLNSQVTSINGTVTSQGSQLTTLTNRVSTVEGSVANKADSSVVSSLDSKVTTIDGKVTQNANAITTLTGRVTTVENGLTNKADTSVLVNYSTKTETNTAIATGIQNYNASLVIGSVNVLLNSEAARTSVAASNKEYLLYEHSTDLKAFYDENLGKPVTISFEMSVPVAGSVYVYTSNDSAHSFSIPVVATEVDKFVKYAVTVTPAVHPSTPAATQSTLEFYGIYGTGRIPTIRKAQVEAGTKATAWSPSPRDTQAALDTNASAITITQANVTALDGLISSNSNEITTLKSRVITVEGVVNTNQANLINNYYTKAESDDKATTIAAGKISAYDANLVIGGVNLIPNSFDIPQWADHGGTWPLYVDVINGVRRIRRIGGTAPAIMSNYTGVFIDLPVGTTYTTSVKVRPVGSDYSLGFYGNDTSIKLCKADQWTTIQDTRTVINQPQRVMGLISYAVQEGVWVEVKEWQVEIGNKATSWSPSPADVQGAINANANAIQTVNAEVSRINGEVVSTANNVNTLTSSVGLLQGSINEVRQTVTNNQESTNTLVTSLKSGMADADDVSMMMRNAAIVFEDLNFRNGYNGIGVYNNYENGALVGNFTDKLPDNPVASTRQLQFIHSGGDTTPALGGFYQATQSRANGVFLMKFVAKLPVGCRFDLAANAYGDGANGYFIGSSEGTGKFKTYYAVFRCGTTGSFSTVGFVYVQGSHPTPENPLIWYLASSTVYDCLDSKVVPDSVINGIAEAKSTASTAVNKAEASAVMAQNLQASLDNTNANISNNYYTKAEADNVVAGKVEQFSSSMAVGGANLWSIVNATRISEHGSHSVAVIREDEEEVHITINSLSGGFSIIRFDSCLVDQNTPFIEGEDVVLSYEVSASWYQTLGTVYAYVGNVGSAIFNVNLPLDLTKWKRVVHKFKATGTQLNGSRQLLGFKLQSADGWQEGTTLKIRHVQLQRGNTATAFSKSHAITRATVKETTQTVNGIQAIKTVSVNNNGFISGYGLISQLVNGVVQSAFGVNADYFYVGTSTSNQKKPFMVLTSPQTIDGVTYPAGTWMDVALIANATIGTAHIADASITNAKIASLDAGKITTGILDANRIAANSISADKINVTELSAITGTIGVLRTATSGSRMEIRDNVIKCYDGNVLRVQLGNLSL